MSAIVPVRIELATSFQIAKCDGKDVCDRAGRARVKAEKKLGDKLKEFPKAKGAEGNPGGRGVRVGIGC